MTTLSQIKERMRRQAERGDRRHAQLDHALGQFDERVAQVEANTARITRLEEQVAAVVAALPKLKGLT